jgi:hypothetical protein
MEITEEAFTRLNTAQWRVLPVLNVRELDEDAVKRLANAFGKCSNVDFGRLAEQFGRGHRGGDHREVEYFTKAKPTRR